MVSSQRVDALNNPARALLDLFTEKTPLDLDTFPTAVANHFSEIFASDDAFQEIPALDIDHPPSKYDDNALVRFRAMIQDTSPSPELYLAKYNSGQCGGWGLSKDAQTDDSSSAEVDDVDSVIEYADLRECAVVWAVSIPGESAWCRDGNSISDSTENKGQNSASTSQSHKFPIPDAKHVGVRLKIYDGNLAQSLKSTDTHSFVGILSSESLNTDRYSDTDTDKEVPTLHVLFSRPLTSTIVPRKFPYTLPKDSQTTSVLDLRNELITWIADEGLAGDRDAAEWVLLCVLSRVQSRTPPILPPSLNISRFPPPSTLSKDSTSPAPEPILPTLLSYILPTVTSVPLSLNTINTTDFYPQSKDEDLHAGWLQLASGSTMCLWEGGLSEGGVNEKGIMNLRAIQEIMNGQAVDYVFPFSKFSFPTDIVCITISEGRKSTFFQTSINVPLKPSSKEAEIVQRLYQAPDRLKVPHADKLEMFRGLIGGAKIGKVTINDNVAEHIQEDFVKERQTGGGDQAVTSEDLVHRIMTARLLALSYQSEEVTIDIWERTKALEASRKARF
ncbi:hypothetical protein HGRIS_013401 [Hohenbuehelia grisea]|uniref:Mini-chromosome maintenance complex-binding protein n=1 Tax=Hohenbuehelia grisea TaxID=104357 RepID=A0ABR3IVC3_9AGAR